MAESFIGSRETPLSLYAGGEASGVRGLAFRAKRKQRAHPRPHSHVLWTEGPSDRRSNNHLQLHRPDLDHVIDRERARLSGVDPGAIDEGAVGAVEVLDLQA